jgi:hypothetical protein
MPRLIKSFNRPQTREDVVRIVFFALYEALEGFAHVVEQGDSVEIQFDGDVPGELEDGCLVFMTSQEHLAYRNAVNAGRIADAAREVFPPETKDDDDSAFST